MEGLIRARPLKRGKPNEMITWIFNARTVQRARSRTPNRADPKDKSPVRPANNIEDEIDVVRKVSLFTILFFLSL